MYNITTLQNANTVSDIFIFANSVSAGQAGDGGILFGLIIIAIYFILIMRLKKYDFDEAILAVSFACFVLSIFLVQAKLLNFIFILIFLTVTAGFAFYMYVVRR
jgi:membrane-associated HD superfamily phosphohydrolase